MAAGSVSPNFINTAPKREQTFTPQKAYPAAIEQTGRDYDNLMGRYRSALSSKSSVPETYTPYVPGKQEFNPVTGIEDLESLSSTGGLDEASQGALRARAVSPIRAIYANAMRQMERQKVLSGGYAPNAGAAQSRMARELSESVGGATTDINARIAQMVQSGKLQAAPQLASIRAGEANRQSGIERENISAQERADQFNRSMMAQMQGQNQNRELELLGGARSLYGTTPALASTFGNQALQAESMRTGPTPGGKIPRYTSTGGAY